jgi:hypothetical protein
LHHLSFSAYNLLFPADYKGLSALQRDLSVFRQLTILPATQARKRTILARKPILRELPPTPVTGPTLVYKRAKSGAASFFCSRCGLDFATTDPLEAFQDFARHQHDCASSPRARKTRAVS